MYATINNQRIPFDTLREIILSKDTLNIRGETTTEVQWLKVDRILGSLSIGDTIEFRVEVRDGGDYVYKRGRGKIAGIEKKQSEFQMRFIVTISIITLIEPKINDIVS